MTPIRTIALGGIGDFGTDSQVAESIREAYNHFEGYSRLQIMRAIVRELELLDVEFWNTFQSDMTVENQNNCYTIRERLNDCRWELNRLEAKFTA